MTNNNNSSGKFINKPVFILFLNSSIVLALALFPPNEKTT